MPSRRLPQTDAKRTKAIQTPAGLTNTLPQSQWLITVPQNTTLQGILSPWRSNQLAAATTLSDQTTATATCDACFTNTTRVISHFIQVLNLAIERGKILPGARALYHLPVSHAEVPEINTSPDAFLWAQRLEDGEAARITAGGLPLAWPAIGEVTAEAALLLAAETGQAAKKFLFDQAQQAIATQRPAVDALILDLWDTIEHNLRHEPNAASRRRIAREWGVVYINDDGSEETDEPTPPVEPPANPNP